MLKNIISEIVKAVKLLTQSSNTQISTFSLLVKFYFYKARLFTDMDDYILDA